MEFPSHVALYKERMNSLTRFLCGKHLFYSGVYMVTVLRRTRNEVLRMSNKFCHKKVGPICLFPFSFARFCKSVFSVLLFVIL
jgi:hypothetical protein